MTPEAQRIAIAEACGWTEIQPSKYAPFGKPYLVGRSPNKFVENLLNIPDFCNDLNAMHEAENVLTNEQWWLFVEFLTEIRGGGVALCISATAAQRAEAFLKALNLWKP
jgi:hypothetical protein